MRSLIIVFVFLIVGCKQEFKEQVISLENYKVVDGFKLEMIASEPLLGSPVAIDFDDKGRIWVAEMTGFMRNLESTGEEIANGAIRILEDRDKDGVMDHSKPFLDSLVMPRALKLVYGGLLYAVPPNLYFVEIENDQPKNRVLVDSLYAVTGNPEHQPNGLMLNIDNWIYNAKSHFRYQRKNGKWIKEPTTFRGQWGISHDNFGRLVYNTNSTLLLGDHILPNRAIENKFYKPEFSVNQKLTKDNRVFPTHAASVNRGYIDGVLNKDSLLVNVTASCGPLVYRGGSFPEDYNENVFVCIPEVNLIKRTILTNKGDHNLINQAWGNKEFLTSTDEGFRPVNLNNGPNGDLYVVDLHRGVIQHQAYLSPYLKAISKKKNLDTLIDAGRILRINKVGRKEISLPNFEELDIIEIVPLLLNENGWIRDRAQQYLILKQDKGVEKALRELALDQTKPISQLHALYTLQGMDLLNSDFVFKVLESENSDVVVTGIILLEGFITKEDYKKVAKKFSELLKKEDLTIDLYLSSTVGKWLKQSNENFSPIFYELLGKYKGNKIILEALISGVSGIEEMLLSKSNIVKEQLFYNLLETTIQHKEDNKPNSIFVEKAGKIDSRTKGALLFRKICVACHGVDGEGIKEVGPPLNNSEYVGSNPERLGLILLHGLQGPVMVRNKKYEFGHAMPGLLYNTTVSDKDISAIISYVSSAFSRTPFSINGKQVKELREVKPQSNAGFTISELEERPTESTSSNKLIGH